MGSGLAPPGPPWRRPVIRSCGQISSCTQGPLVDSPRSDRMARPVLLLLLVSLARPGLGLTVEDSLEQGIEQDGIPTTLKVTASTRKYTEIRGQSLNKLLNNESYSYPRFHLLPLPPTSNGQWC